MTGLLADETGAGRKPYVAPRQVTLAEDVRRLGGLLSSLMPDAFQHGSLSGAARNTARALQGGHYKVEYGPNGEVYQTDEWIPYDGGGINRLFGVNPLLEFAGGAGVAAPLAKVPKGALMAFGDVGNIRGKHASPHKFFHVAPEDYKGDDLVSLRKQFGEDAYEEFLRRWPESGNMGQVHADRVFMFDDPQDAAWYRDEYGGKILEIDPSDLDILYDDFEIPHGKTRGYPYVEGEIPASNIVPRDGEPIKGLLSEGGGAFGGVSDDAAEAAREAAEAALKRRMEHSVYQRGDKVFDPAEALEKSGLIRRNRDGHDWATGPLPDVIPDDIMKKSRQGDYGDLLIDAKDAPESWFDDLTDGDGSTLSPYFDKQIRKDDFEFHVSDYDPEDLEYSSITLMPKNEPDLYARLSSDALGEVQIGSLEDALTHENHLARAAAFREVLRQNNVPFETIENGINSEYIFLHDEAADRMLKIRFADHGNQSVHHDRADFNISDDWRDKAHVEKALNAALEFSRPRNAEPIKGLLAD